MLFSDVKRHFNKVLCILRYVKYSIISIVYTVKVKELEHKYIKIFIESRPNIIVNSLICQRIHLFVSMKPYLRSLCQIALDRYSLIVVFLSQVFDVSTFS